ncbi:hypothetical protein [Vibrio nomapromontoriensis]|uniref:hypothetical protein n=1 Tax=Vibrio nomapromontoriensis TaxID=2910246 RepID=UPI003D0DF257
MYNSQVGRDELLVAIKVVETFNRRYGNINQRRGTRHDSIINIVIDMLESYESDQLANSHQVYNLIKLTYNMEGFCRREQENIENYNIYRAVVIKIIKRRAALINMEN